MFMYNILQQCWEKSAFNGKIYLCKNIYITILRKCTVRATIVLNEQCENKN